MAAQGTAGPLLEAREVSVRLGTQTLLAPVSLSVAAGTTLAVVGENGSGKTTLLRVLAGLQRPSSGVARLAGGPVDERDRRFRAHLAALVGTPPVAPDLTLREHLVMVGASWGSEVPAAGASADDLLERLGIGRLAHRFPHEVSSGQAQLHRLALTLARPSDVVLLDEPEQRLDETRLALVADLLRDLVAQGRTLVLASHSPNLVAAIATTVLELHAPGR